MICGNAKVGHSAVSSAVLRAVKKLMDEGAWNDAYLTLRNIATVHPSLVLRHLNTLAAVIEGCMQPSQVSNQLQPVR